MPVTPLMAALLPVVMKMLPAVDARRADADARALHARQHVDPEIAGAAALGEDAVAAGSRAVGDHIAFGAQ